MPLSKDQKAKTHERIIATAARLFRRDGMDGVSIPSLMKEIGMTQGGFYAHFASKDVLAAEAIERGFAETVDRMAGLALKSNPINAVVSDYLRPEDPDHPEMGCVVAALGVEAARGAPVVQQAMARGIGKTADHLSKALNLGEGTEDAAIALYAGMVGALVLARASCSDRALSDRVLKVCTRHLQAAFR